MALDMTLPIKAVVVTQTGSLRRILKSDLDAAGITTVFCDLPEEIFSLSNAEIPDIIIIDQVYQTGDTKYIVSSLQSHPKTKQAWIAVLVPRSSEMPSFYYQVNREALSVLACPFGPSEISMFLTRPLDRIKKSGLHRPLG